MSESCRFDCYLIGSTSRLIACGRLLLEKGHHICGVISNESDIVQWAKENGLHLIMPNDNLLAILSGKTFDLFISINNFWKIPNEILTLPEKYAINFHDGPLPKYAGVNATNWAIMNEETSHGITWHIMTEEIDAGDILKQMTFPLSEKETALSLNTKCYEKSIQCFSDLLCDLEKSKETRIPQNLNLRTYYPRWKRPSAACTIDWNQSAEQIYALYRALEFGNYPNPLGLPKLLINDQPVIVTQIDPLLTKSNQIPGTIISVTDEMICVSTKTNDISLSQLKSSYGKLLNPSVLLKESGFCVGELLTKIEDRQAEIITKINAKLCKHENFWIRQLQNLKPLEIPYAKSHALLNDSIQYKRMEFRVAESVLSSIDKSINKNELILSASILYLSRLGNKTCFDINYQDSSLRKQLSGAEYFYSPVIPLHVEINEKYSFREFHDSIKSMIESHHSHGSFPIDLILRSPVLRKTANNNQFRELPVTIIYGEDKIDYHSLKKSDLIMVLPENRKECVWIYDSDVIKESDVQRMRDQFVALLTEIAQAENKNVTKISILPEYDKKLLLSDWGKQEIKNNFSGCIHHRFESQVDKNPDAIGLIYENKSLTYRQLNRCANHVARYLRSNGVGPEVMVGLCMERGFNLIIGLLGILKAGGAYVPLDPEYPNDRLAFIINDAQTPVILTQKNLESHLPKNSAKIICLDAWDLQLISDDESNDENASVDIQPHNLAYVIYTSGSTGKPKGVLVTHNNVARLFDSTEEWFHFTKTDTWTLFHSYAFDFSVWEIWGALFYGGRLVIVPFKVSRSPKDFYKLLVKERITILNQIPSAFYQLMEAEEIVGPSNNLSLRFIIFGGEALELQKLHTWFKIHGDVKPQLINMFGITETTVHVTYRPVTLEDVKKQLGSMIGIPIPDLKIYVLDKYMQPLPIGIPGELYVGGSGVSRGYLKRPEITNQKFVKNPFDNKNNPKLYKTGDLVCLHPNLDLEYLGRIDFQVQIRGFRVELGEIETVLSSHDSIVQAVVILHEYNSEDKRLIAYIVVKDHTSISRSQIREYLKRTLPDYMIPHHIIKLDTLPTTPSGKLDRKNLPLPEEKQQTDGSYMPPQSEVEKTIAEIWQELLHSDAVGIHDSFFDLGGHSLLLIKMLNKLQNQFGKEVTTNDFFRYPTIEMLAKYLTQEKATTRSFETTHKLIEQQRLMLKKRKNYSIPKEADDNGK
jgi:amino acid adenylation domain-containing protein